MGESAQLTPPRGLARRSVLTGAASGIASRAMFRAAFADTPAGETEVNVAPQPTPIPDQSLNSADVVVETLISWGASHVFGIVGDGINSIIEALRKRQDRIAFIGVRHEEAAAFMAGGFAKQTGRLGVCLATTGPGAVHLMNGLYDAHMDGAPVLAITGMTFHDLIGTRFQQDVDTVALMSSVALYNVEITGPRHALIVSNIACRTALGRRGVAHLTLAKDVQMKKLGDDKPSMENHGGRTSTAWLPVLNAPGPSELRAAADIFNGAKKVAVLAGQGALQARPEVEGLAEALGAPVAKSLLGKAVLPDDSPYTTGGIGHLGTAPSHWAMHNCDAVLILGSTMPWIDSYPKPGQAKGVQVDLMPERLGLRYPVDVGLVGDVKTTLQALLPFLGKKTDRSFLDEAQSRMSDWNALLGEIEKTERSPLRPQMVVRAVSDLIAPDAMIALDCGANTHFSARHLRLKRDQSLIATGMLATMAPGLPFAIAAQLANRGRQSVTIVGDGGFAMLMAELSTAVRLELPIKVILLKNNSLSEVRFEQQDLGNPVYGCDLSPIDFVAFAKACGAEGFRCEKPEEVRPAISAALTADGPALVEAIVDSNEPPLKPEELRV
jgi:pyruvate dehydrogenase (quinone)